MEQTMDEKGYQTIIAILDQRASRRLWFTIHLIVFAVGVFIFGGSIQRIPLFQDGHLINNIWPLLLIAHFIYMCFRDIHGRLLRRRIEQDAAETQISQYPEKRKNSRLIDEDEGADEYSTFNNGDYIRENKRR